jgi:hypothetical protein
MAWPARITLRLGNGSATASYGAFACVIELRERPLKRARKQWSTQPAHGSATPRRGWFVDRTLYSRA